jgi:hypothetical protein
MEANLPICDIPITSEKLIEMIGEQSKFTIDESHKVYDIVSSFVEADCWCVTVGINDTKPEILFNMYNEHYLYFREKIINDSIKDRICEDPHRSLFVYLHRMRVDAVIDIYMLRDESYKLQIKYDGLNKMFDICGFTSADIYY